MAHYTVISMSNNYHETTCLGCQLANNTMPAYHVYETEHVSCILDHDPFNEGHVLILPKSHVKEVYALEAATAAEMMNASILMSKAIHFVYQPDGITICQNGGRFDDLGHVHVHVVPRYHHQRFADFYDEVPSDNDHLKKKLAETQSALTKAIQELKMSKTP